MQRRRTLDVDGTAEDPSQKSQNEVQSDYIGSELGDTHQNKLQKRVSDPFSGLIPFRNLKGGAFLLKC